MVIDSPDKNDLFAQITTAESLFEAWEIFQKGKRARRDVQIFWRRLEGNIFRLRGELISGSYRHGRYESFFVHDPKPRHIRKAQVRDRIVHQALYSVLSQIWEPTLIYDVYSARLGKGTHYGVNRLSMMVRKVSRNFTSSCWALKCDVRKLYDSMDHAVLLDLIGKRIGDARVIRLIEQIVGSFHSKGFIGKGIPIGNVTSQIFTNIYLNELDYFVKQTLRVQWYGRFSDDFVLLSPKRSDLFEWREQIGSFLQEHLLLALHPHKVFVRPLHQGIDFLGYVLLPHHRVLRTSTKRRMLRRLARSADGVVTGKIAHAVLCHTLASYRGMIGHADAFELGRMLDNSCSVAPVG
jgi:retron-type reverse transcriptase